MVRCITGGRYDGALNYRLHGLEAVCPKQLHHDESLWDAWDTLEGTSSAGACPTQHKHQDTAYILKRLTRLQVPLLLLQHNTQPTVTP